MNNVSSDKRNALTEAETSKYRPLTIRIMAKFKTTEDLVKKITKDNAFNSCTTRALSRIAETSNNKGTTKLSVYTNYIMDRYKVDHVMAVEAATQFV